MQILGPTPELNQAPWVGYRHLRLNAPTPSNSDAGSCVDPFRLERKP